MMILIFVNHFFFLFIDVQANSKSLFNKNRLFFAQARHNREKSIRRTISSLFFRKHFHFERTDLSRRRFIRPARVIQGKRIVCSPLYIAR